MVGIMRAGAGYVPLDPKLPLDRLRYLVEQCECKSVVVHEKHVECGGSLGVEAVVAQEVLYGQHLPQHRTVTEDAHSLAYVLFTSGSTGKPKGVMVQHSSLVAFLCHESTLGGPYRCLSSEREFCRLYVLSFTFDDSVGVVWRTLVTGARLLVGKPDAWLDPSYLVELMATHNVTSLWGVPSPFALVMDAAQNVLPPSLTDLHLIGEAPH